jgi:hypothetical protein
MKKIKLNIDRLELIKQIGEEFLDGYGVEVGTFKGEFSKQIMEIWGGTLFMVDVWRGLGDEYKDASNHSVHTNAYAEAMKNIEGYENRAIMVRGTSEVTAEMFEDESLDFVFIDANHAYDYVVQDIELWHQKVRHGGYLLGHDYIDMDWEKDPHFADCYGKNKHIYSSTGFYFGVFGVNPAVDQFCKTNNYELTLTNEWFGTWMIKK